jgi:hypothetical protein
VCTYLGTYPVSIYSVIVILFFFFFVPSYTPPFCPVNEAKIKVMLIILIVLSSVIGEEMKYWILV